MTSRQFGVAEFDGPDGVLEYVKCHADDIASLVICGEGEIAIDNADGTPADCRGYAGGLELCDDSIVLMERRDIEMLVADGLLSRLRIPVQRRSLRHPNQDRPEGGE